MTDALNEGRGSNPGDTSSAPDMSAATPGAQRRPGFEPRRHLVLDPGRVEFARSTKAGVRTPATPRGSRIVKLLVRFNRSTKAGVRTPATPRRTAATRPATPALNEGRGSNPGDTARSSATSAACGRRSTKAGVRTPATPERMKLSRCALSSAQRRPGFEPRRHPSCPTASGGPSVAQRRPGFEPRRHRCIIAQPSKRCVRSTKAGVRTPATLLIVSGEGPGERIAHNCGCEGPWAMRDPGRSWLDST